MAASRSADGDHLRHPPGVDQVPPLAPPLHLSLDEAVGPAEIPEADGRRVEQVQVGERVDDGEPDAAGRVVVVGHLRRDVVPHHDAAAVLDDEEVGADHAVVVAEQVAARRAVEVTRQRVDGPELPAHVVGAGSEPAERRPPHDELGVADAHEVGEVGRAVRELQHAERPVEAGDVGPQVGVEAGPVEVLAGAHRPRPRRRSVRTAAQPSTVMAPSGQLSAASRAASSCPAGTSTVVPRSVTKPSSS